MSGEAQCVHCHADIVWVISLKKVQLPLDVRPVVNGAIHYTGRLLTNPNGMTTAEVDDVPRESRVGVPQLENLRYELHLNTCPRKDLWMKGVR